MQKYDLLIKMIKIASILDESNKYFLSDKLVKIAQESKEQIETNSDPALYSNLINYLKKKLVQKYNIYKADPDLKKRLKDELNNILDNDDYYKENFVNLTIHQQNTFDEQLKRIIEQLSDTTLTSVSEEDKLLKLLLEKYGIDFKTFKNQDNNLFELNQKIAYAIKDLDSFIAEKYPNLSNDNKSKLKSTLTNQLINTRDMYSARAVTQRGGIDKFDNPLQIPGSQSINESDAVEKAKIDERYTFWKDSGNGTYKLLDHGITGINANSQQIAISSGGRDIFIYSVDKPVSEIVDEINKKIGPNFIQLNDPKIQNLKLTIPGVNFSIKNLKEQLLVFIQDQLYQNNSKNPYNDFQFAFEGANLQDIINDYNKKFNYQLNVWPDLKDKKITINSTGSPSTILNEILRLSDGDLVDMHDIDRSYPDASYYIIPAQYLRNAREQNSKA